MKILVTGGAGFIGSHAVDLFVEAGHEVVVVDNLSSGKLENVNPRAKFHLMDIRSGDIDKLFELERPDVVNHFAAQTSVPKSVEDPLLDLDMNLRGLLNLLNACVKYTTRKFIFISTGGAIYGDASVRPTPETYLPDMVSPYALTKHTSEKYLSVYSKLYGLQYTALRLANVYGPRQIPKGESGVVPIFVNNLLNNERSVLYAPDGMPRGATRDYIHVADVCRANLLALDKASNEVVNIGTGREIFMEDIYIILQSAAGKDLPLVRKGLRFGDVLRSALDCAKAATVLGWRYAIEPEDGLKSTYQYYSERRVPEKK